MTSPAGGTVSPSEPAPIPASATPSPCRPSSTRSSPTADRLAGTFAGIPCELTRTDLSNGKSGPLKCTFASPPDVTTGTFVSGLGQLYAGTGAIFWCGHNDIRAAVATGIPAKITDAINLVLTNIALMVDEYKAASGDGKHYLVLALSNGTGTGLDGDLDPTPFYEAAQLRLNPELLKAHKGSAWANSIDNHFVDIHDFLVNDSLTPHPDPLDDEDRLHQIPPRSIRNLGSGAEGHLNNDGYPQVAGKLYGVMKTRGWFTA